MTLADLPVAVSPEEVAEFCRARGIHKLSFFGSVLRDDFSSDSDVDVLVEYELGRHPGLMLFRHQDELSTLLGRTVDLHTPASLSRVFRADVLAEALPVYEQA
ncbi:nucleotidyltransferase family protein [Verrucomicrobiota bacterium sgz303538]